MDLSYGTCMAISLFASMSCDHPPLDFKQVYAAACYRPADPKSNWAGLSGELTTNVMKRLAEGTALYQDYLKEYHERCDKR